MKLLTCLCSVIACLSSFAVYPQFEADINAKIKKIISRNLPEASVGVVVQDNNTGNILYDYDSSKHFMPASTTKLFTAAAALKELGPNYSYETALFRGKYGDIAIKFSGDPSFQAANLYDLLKKITELKISSVNNIWLDDSLFDGPMLGYGWTADSTAWYHAAPVSAIIIDLNQIAVTLFPATAIGSKVKAKLEPDSFYGTAGMLQVNMLGVTAQDSEDLCQILPQVDEQNNVALSGCWPVGSEPVHLRLAIKNPRTQAKKLILSMLENLKIKIRGSVMFGSMPDGLAKVASHNSVPLHELLQAVLGESNNLYAESLLKTLGAKLYGTGSFKTGVLALQKSLSQFTGLDFSQIKLHDGSGGSRYNLISPLSLSRLLYVVDHDANLRPYFRRALSLSGVSGTLKRRFAAFDAKANINAKTGTLNGVSALSGYLVTSGKRDLTVTIMVNQSIKNSLALKQFENELCYYLISEI